ncbi:hypothetical protein RFI_04141 [Reticulomyxa filosa]|uniref:Uncharacterized protein n=1 Tax=Reticulomyxa filosa TaxID=46433 RepID=X6P5T0_RETFI|nr:hypothetical protein RFI_04141 [Reticulomyxa filosa]|eukprot:ETO32967.1 hypothetical protein RFI_04141 [Reticulomyxa filosa]
MASKLDCQNFLDQKLQEITSPDTINKYYVLANDFVNNLLAKQKEIISSNKTSPFSCIYGVMLSGCVQKQLVIPSISCGYLVFLYHLKERHFDNSNVEPFEKKHKDILKWMKQSIEKMKNEFDKDEIRILRYSRSSLRIEWKGVEYHIAIAWTFWKRQYCAFDYTQNNVHVYKFLAEQLQIAASDLVEEAPIHQRHIRKTNARWKKFLEKNMSSSLSLLRVYYMRGESIGKNVRSAIMFLKMWQHYQMKGKQHLSNNSLEIMCVHLFDRLKKKSQCDTPIFSFDIIAEFFHSIMQFKKCASKKILPMEWPYQKNKFQCLIKSKHIHKYKQTFNSGDIVILDNLIIR